MRNSSDNTVEVFAHLELRQALVLVEVLKETTLRSRSHVEARFKERARHFHETLAFLQAIGIVEESRNGLRQCKHLQEAISDRECHTASFLLDRLLASRNSYSEVARSYLTKFKLSDGQLTLPTQGEGRGKWSAIRNFLMEANVVCYDMDSDTYTIAAEHLDLYLRSKSRRRHLSPRVLANCIADQEAVGCAAEEAVVLYERQRVGILMKELVEHIALKNVAAGYDIKSITGAKGGLILPRYIEVKAVSGNNWSFFWTANEIATAKLLREYYYLYLIPVAKGQSFQIDHVKIIQNPYLYVRQNSHEWQVEENVVRCTPRRSISE